MKFYGETYQMATSTLKNTVTPITPPTTVPQEVPGCSGPTEPKSRVKITKNNGCHSNSVIRSNYCRTLKSQ